MTSLARPHIHEADRKVIRRWALASVALHVIIAGALIVSAVVVSQAKQPVPADPQTPSFKETGAPVGTVASAPVAYRVA